MPFAPAAVAAPAPSEKSGGAVMLRVLVVWLIVCALFIGTKGKALLGHDFPDPDDTLRLLQVRDLLAGQGWFDLHQYRVAAPDGVAMHWSRLVDLPLAGLILLLRPLLGAPLAESVACVAIPLLTLLIAFALVARLAARLFDVEVASFACLLAALCVPAMIQFQPLRIDHHGWQIVAALVALNGLFARNRRIGGLVVGLAMAATLAISIEGLPLTAAFLGVLGLRFLSNRADHAGLVNATAALAVGSLGLFLATRGLADLAQHCDAVSPAHLAAFGVAAGGVALLPRLSRRPPVVIALAAAGIGALAVGVLLTAAPACSQGAFAALDPLVRRFWYANVLEGQPVWRLGITEMVFMAGPPLVGLAALVRLWWIAPEGAARRRWLDYALVMAGAALIGLLVTRASATAALMAAPAAAWLVRDRMRAVAAAGSALWQRAGNALLALLLAFPGTAVLVADAWGLSPHDPGDKLSAVEQARQCNFKALASVLNRLPATDIFTPMDFGPQILLETHHRVVATAHHRNVAGLHDLIAGFLAPPEAARAILAKRHAGLVVLCPGPPEVGNYIREAPEGLAAQLLTGHAPRWLQPLPMPKDSRFVVWRVVQPPTP